MTLPAPYYQHGPVTLYLGDCRDILPDLGSVGLVLTDPPYAASGAKAEWQVTASVAIGLHQAARLVRKGGAALVFTTSSGRGMDFTRAAIGNALPFNRLLVWHKTFVRSRVAGPWRWDLVSIMVFGRGSFGRPEQSSVFRSPGPASPALLGATGHPAELPPGIADWLYTPFDRADQVVLDPFMGSGTLLLPAAEAGRACIGIELEEKYCEIAARRLEQTLVTAEVA